MLLLLLACSPPAPDGTQGSATTPPATTGTGPGTGTSTVSTTPTTITTGSTTSTAASRCDLTDPAQAVVAWSLEEVGGMVNQRRVAVELAVPGGAAVACAPDADPADLHLLWSADAATHHELQVTGLLADTAYTCKAWPVCPASPVPAATAAFAVDPWGVEVPSYLVSEVHPTLARTAGHVFVVGEVGTDDRHPVLTQVDELGRVRWFLDRFPSDYDIGFEVAWRDDALGPGVAYGGGESALEGSLGRLDVAGNPLYLGPRFREEYTHDALLREDGTWVALFVDDDVQGPSTVEGFRVRWWDPARDDEVLWAWSSQEAVDTGELPFEEQHANSLLWVEEGGVTSAWVSLCNARRIVRIDVATGAVDWALGTNGDFQFYDQDGSLLDADSMFECTHGLHKDGDRLLVYENGIDRRWSRVLELRLDEARREAHVTWEWDAGDMFNRICGEVDPLPADRYLVTVGDKGRNEATDPGVIEVDRPSGEVVWRLRDARHPDDVRIYRAEHVAGCSLHARVQACPTLLATFPGPLPTW